MLGDSCSNIVDYESTWDEGASGTIHAKFPIATSSWHMTVTFDLPITDFTVWVGGRYEVYLFHIPRKKFFFCLPNFSPIYCSPNSNLVSWQCL